MPLPLHLAHRAAPREEMRRNTYFIHIFQSVTMSLTACRSSTFISCKLSSLSRRRTSSLSLMVRNLAFSGQSAIRNTVRMDTAAVAPPSTMKILACSVRCYPVTGLGGPPSPTWGVRNYNLPSPGFVTSSASQVTDCISQQLVRRLAFVSAFFHRVHPINHQPARVPTPLNAPLSKLALHTAVTRFENSCRL